MSILTILEPGLLLFAAVWMLVMPIVGTGYLASRMSGLWLYFFSLLSFFTALVGEVGILQMLEYGSFSGPAKVVGMFAAASIGAVVGCALLFVGSLLAPLGRALFKKQA